MFSTYSNSIIRSANSLKDHLPNPFGGSLQAIEINRASVFPSIFLRYILLVGATPRAASRPSSTNLCFILSMVRIPIFSTLHTSSLVCGFSANLPWSALSRMREWMIFLAVWLPFLIFSINLSLSSFVKVTLYFMIAFFDKDTKIFNTSYYY